MIKVMSTEALQRCEKRSIPTWIILMVDVGQVVTLELRIQCKISKITLTHADKKVL